MLIDGAARKPEETARWVAWSSEHPLVFSIFTEPAGALHRGIHTFGSICRDEADHPSPSPSLRTGAADGDVTEWRELTRHSWHRLTRDTMIQREERSQEILALLRVSLYIEPI